MDRNYYPVFANLGEQVALLAEGVDRNTDGSSEKLDNLIVALLAEGVDRNMLSWIAPSILFRRPPRRGRG